MKKYMLYCYGEGAKLPVRFAVKLSEIAQGLKEDYQMGKSVTYRQNADGRVVFEAPGVGRTEVESSWSGIARLMKMLKSKEREGLVTKG